MSKPILPSELSDRERANYYYHQRLAKYTFDDHEKKLLHEILNDIKAPPHKYEYKGNYKNYQIKLDYLTPDPQTGYKTLVTKIKMKLRDIREENEKKAKKRIYKYLPNFLVQTNTANLETALEYVKYHHYALKRLNQPDIAFRRTKGKNANLKQFETNPDFTVPLDDDYIDEYGPRDLARNRNPFTYSAKNISAYLKKRSFSIFGISFGKIGNLYNAFQDKISLAKINLTQTYNKQDKTALRQDLQSNHKILYPPQSLSPEIIDANTTGMVTHAEIIEYSKLLNGPLKQNMENLITKLVSSHNDISIRINPSKKRNAFVSDANRRIQILEEIKALATQIISASAASTTPEDKVIAETIINEATVDQNALRALALKFSTLMKSSEDENDYNVDSNELAEIVPSPTKVCFSRRPRKDKHATTQSFVADEASTVMESASATAASDADNSDDDSSDAATPLSTNSSPQHSP